MDVFVLHSRETGFELLADELRRLGIPFGPKVPDGAAERNTTAVLWGKHLQEPGGLPVLNRLSCVLRSGHAGLLGELLELNGIKCALTAGGESGNKRGKAAYLREYRVPVFQQDVLALYERKTIRAAEGELSAILVETGSVSPIGENSSREAAGRSFREIPVREAAYQGRRAMREAVKAVYAAGLDYALVSVGITKEAQTFVTGVEPVPALDSELARLFAEAFARYASQEAGERRVRGETEPGQNGGVPPSGGTVVLGADPEFILVRPDGKVAAASRYLERAGDVGCDGVVLRERLIRPLVELRPAPSADPRRLVARLRGCMRRAAALIRDPALAWVAGGMPVRGLPLGGHIHFSGVALNSALLRALDAYVALPCALLESADDRKRRPRYGALGDSRRKPHGGFEYRTLPACWLAAPRFAAGVLSLAALVAANYRRLPRLPLLQADMQRLFYAAPRERLLSPARDLWRELEALPDYARFRTDLDGLKAVLFAAAPPESGRDFRPAWKIASGEAGAPSQASPAASSTFAPSQTASAPLMVLNNHRPRNARTNPNAALHTPAFSVAPLR